jgi:dTDP-glucose 4,6-dehydratase
MKKMSEESPVRTITKALITGGAGFIGSHLVKFLGANTDWDICVLDALTYAGSLSNLEDDPNAVYTRFVKADISKSEELEFLKKEKFDIIIHLAAESHVDRSIDEPQAFVKTNVNGTVNMLELGMHYFSSNPDFIFYHVSTDEVFGSLELKGKKKFNEKTSYDPRSPYSASKAASDHFVRAYHHTYGLPVLISNCSNNYGTHQYPEKLIPVVINKLKKREPIPVYGSGINMRDWLHVEDHCSAIYEIIKKGKFGKTYCIGGNNVMSNNKLVKTICDLYDYIYKPETRSRGLIVYVEDRKGHDLRYAIDATKMKKKLGWKPSVDFIQGLTKTIEWYAESR